MNNQVLAVYKTSGVVWTTRRWFFFNGYYITTVKHLVGGITEYQLPRIIWQVAAFSFTPKRSSSNQRLKNGGKNTYPVGSKYMFYYSGPIEEYESRQVEFGQGYTKSKAWSNEAARKFQKRKERFIESATRPTAATRKGHISCHVFHKLIAISLFGSELSPLSAFATRIRYSYLLELTIARI